MLKGRESKRPFSTSVPPPNARSTLIEPLVAVELFGIEEMKPELLAAGATARADGAARSSGFFSSTSKTLTAMSASIKVDPAFGAGADVADQRLTSRLFTITSGRDSGHDL